MYNLSLPNLSATLLPDVYRSSPNYQLTLHALYCAVPFIATCVDVTRTVFRDCSLRFTSGATPAEVTSIAIKPFGTFSSIGEN